MKGKRLGTDRKTAYEHRGHVYYELRPSRQYPGSQEWQVGVVAGAPERLGLLGGKESEKRNERCKKLREIPEQRVFSGGSRTSIRNQKKEKQKHNSAKVEERRANLVDAD